MAELAYALVLGTSPARVRGSNPLGSTKITMNIFGRVLFLAVIFCLATGILIYIFHRPDSGRVCAREHCFEVMLAKTKLQQRRGLMFQDSLESDKGMLFIFNQEKKHTFWMKNTKIPLDIIWIDKNNTVVFISKNNQPCTSSNCTLIEPSQDAKYVLEIRGGMAEAIDLQLGDQVIIEI